MLGCLLASQLPGSLPWLYYFQLSRTRSPVLPRFPGMGWGEVQIREAEREVRPPSSPSQQFPQAVCSGQWDSGHEVCW